MYYILLLLMLVSCKGLEYKDDGELLSSAAANSMEFAVRIGDQLCRDMDGELGLCSKRVREDRELVFKHDPLPYPYQFFLTCSKEIDSDFNASVPSNTAYSYVIRPEKYSGVRSFICIGKIVPGDREGVDAKYEVRVKIFSKNYLTRERITLYKDYIVLGNYAKYARVFDGKYWYRLFQQTTMKVRDPSKVKAYSESANMRYNYFNWE